MTARSLVVLAIVLGSALGVVSAGAEPSAGGTVTIGVDADASGNEADVLGTRDGCVAIGATAGTQAIVDVYVDAVPSGEELSGFNYYLEFDDQRLKIVDQDHALLLSTRASGKPVDLSEPTPAASSPHQVAVANLTEAGPTGPVSGVLGRYTFEVAGGASAGVSTISLSVPEGSGYLFGPNGAEIPVDQTVAARIAVGESCTATENPTPKPIPKESPVADQTPGGNGDGNGGPDGTNGTPSGAEGTPTATGTPDGGDGGENNNGSDGGGNTSDDGGVSAWLIVAIAAGGVAAIGGGAGYWWWRRRNP